MSRLTSANKEQRELIRELNRVANNCPAISDREAFEEFQANFLQPIRDLIIAAGEKGKEK
jgi:hypothetical protein